MFRIKYNLNNCIEDHRLILLHYIFISTETSMHTKKYRE